MAVPDDKIRELTKIPLSDNVALIEGPSSVINFGELSPTSNSPIFFLLISQILPSQTILLTEVSLKVSSLLNQRLSQSLSNMLRKVEDLSPCFTLIVLVQRAFHR